jgi:hypothetical protein
MNRRDIIVGLVILVGLAALIYYWRRPVVDEELQVPQTLSVEDEIEDMFSLQIPEDVDKAELLDKIGGDASAIATREFVDNKFTHTVLADLPDLEIGSYVAELVKDDEVLETGVLRAAKGGYILEYQSDKDLSEYKTVRVKLGDETVLEGSF